MDHDASLRASQSAPNKISMRNVLVHVPHKEKERFAGLLKGIWMTADPATAKQRARDLADQYREKCPKAVETLEEGLEDALTFLAFPKVAPHILCKPRLRWLRSTGAKLAFAPLAAN